MRAGFRCLKCDNFGCLHTRQDRNELHLKIWYFLSKSATSAAKRKRMEWSIAFNSWTNFELCMASYQGLYAKFVSMMSPNCWIVENDSELMLMTLHTHFLSQQQYSRVYALFWAFHALVYQWGCQLLSLFFSQDNEHTERTVLLFFQNPYAIFSHILQHCRDFRRNVEIFPSVVQACTYTVFVRRRDKTNYLWNQTWAKCYHSRNKY